MPRRDRSSRNRGLLLCLALAACGARFAFAQPPAAGEAPPAANAPVKSPLLTEPKTAEAAFDAVVLMTDVARPELAKHYLELMLSFSPDDETLLRFRDKHGPAVFLKLVGVPELKPLASPLLERVNGALRSRDESPTRVDDLIRDLSGTPQEQAIALVTLQGAGAPVVPRLLQHFDQPLPEGERQTLSFALSRMGPRAVPPLIGSLDAGSEAQRIAAIEALGWIGERSALRDLWSPALDPESTPSVRDTALRAIARLTGKSATQPGNVTTDGAIKELRRIGLEHFARRTSLPTDDEGFTVLWAWSPKLGAVVQTRLDPDDVSSFLSLRFARQTLRLAPESKDAQTLFVAASLGDELRRSGWDRTLRVGPGTPHDLALTAGPAVLADALRLSLDNRNTFAALAVLQVLGQVADRHQVSSREAVRTPLLAALNYPDPRVQFAAASAVLQLDPRQTFPGADRVVAIMARALHDTGEPRVLFVDADATRAADMGGFLREAGYESVAARTGQEGFRIACERTDLAFVAIEANVARWGLSQTVANFRADARTAHLPIAIYGSPAVESSLRFLLQRTPQTTFFHDSNQGDAVRGELRPFLERYRAPELSAEQRGLQMGAAVSWLGYMAGGQRTRIYDLTPAEKALLLVVEDEAFAADAIRALGAIPTRSSQLALQKTATNPNGSVELREAAAVQLAAHVQRYGLLLDKGEVAAVERAWKAAEAPQLATALASVIGSLKPDTSLVGRRLVTAPPPIAPGP